MRVSIDVNLRDWILKQCELHGLDPSTMVNYLLLSQKINGGDIIPPLITSKATANAPTAPENDLNIDVQW